jgi:hypothetical protein
MFVVDNIISEKYSQLIFDRLAQLKWTFVPDISVGSNRVTNKPGFSYSFYLEAQYNNKEPKDIVSSEYDLITPMLLEGFDKLNVDFSLSDVFRSRAVLTVQQPGLNGNDLINTPHRDYTLPHWVLIYYVNTIDGDTVLYEDNTVVERVKPVRGRVCLFDGSRIHSSSSPTLGPRIIINNNIKCATSN